MSRINLEHSEVRSPLINAPRFGTLTHILSGTFVITPDGPTFIFLDPNGVQRDVFLPVITGGNFYVIANIGNDEDLNVVDHLGATVTVVEAGSTTMVASSKNSWIILSTISAGPASGVSGPASSTDNAIVRWNGAGGTAVQNSLAIISDPGALSGIISLDFAATTDATLTRLSSGVLGIEGNAILTALTGQAIDPTLTALAAYNTNGLLTQTAADTFAGRTLVGTAGQIAISNGDGVAGNPTLSLPADVLIPTILTVPNTGLHLLDTDASHDLIVKPGSNLTADRILTITTGDADIIVNLSAVTDEFVLAYDVTTNTWRGVAAAASVPTTITVANEAADTTCFPLFVTAATGDLGPKTNANLTYNSSTGAFSIGTAAPLTVGTIELGAASDTTLARVSAGVVSIEGFNILTTATGQPLDATLSALAAYNVNGLLTQTAADTFTGRTLLGTAGQLTVANGSGVTGDPTISLPADVLIPTILTVPNAGLHLLDTDASHDLIIRPGSNITADRTLTLTTGNADRTLDISAASVTISTFGASLVDDADALTARATLGVVIGTNVQAFDTTLAALASYNTNGFLVQTAMDTFAGRTISGPLAGLVITNGDGVAGNLTIALADDLAALESLGGINTIYYRSGSSTWSAVNIGANLTFTAGTLAASSGTATVGDGDYGDIVVSSSGTIWTIDAAAVTYAKMQDVSAASKLLGRGDSGSGDVQEITLGSGLTMTGTTLSAAGGSYTDEQAQDAIGTILLDSSRIDFTYNDATPSITADLITGSVANSFLADMAEARIKGRAFGAGTGVPTDLTGAQVLAIIENTTPLLSEAEAAAGYQPLDATLSALATFSTDGFLAHTGVDTFAARTITGTGGQISVANGDGVAGNPTLSLPADVVIPTIITVPNTGLHIFDIDSSHDLIVKPGSNITADRTFTITTGDANRTLTLSGDATLDDWFDQSVKAAASPTFAGVNLSNTDTTISRVSAGDIQIEANIVYRAGGTDVALADGGTGASLVDPNADRILFWDDSAGAMAFLTAGTGLTITGTTLDASAGSDSTNYQEFTSSGTWTKPGSCTFVMVECWAGGGGGASGRRGTAGQTRNGGTGGGGGAYAFRLFKASECGATETVTIGAGGSAGAAQTVDTTDGNNGGNGGNTTFGSLLTAFGGGGGSAGTNAAIAPGAGGGVLSAGALSVGGQPWFAAANTTGGHFGGAITSATTAQNPSGFGGGTGGPFGASPLAGACSYQGGPGGGCGGFINAANTASAGAAGGSITGATGGGGAAGASAGLPGAAGTGRQGGGGGFGGTTTGGAGGAGGQPAGGGGGGGASLNGNNSGAGGVGGAGLCRVYSW